MILMIKSQYMIRFIFMLSYVMEKYVNGKLKMIMLLLNMRQKK